MKKQIKEDKEKEKEVDKYKLFPKHDRKDIINVVEFMSGLQVKKAHMSDREKM